MLIEIDRAADKIRFRVPRDIRFERLAQALGGKQLEAETWEFNRNREESVRNLCRFFFGAKEAPDAIAV